MSNEYLVEILERLTPFKRGAYIDRRGMVERHLEPLAKGGPPFWDATIGADVGA